MKIICYFYFLVISSIYSYNFVDKQNYEIDLVYNYISGTNVYFPSIDNKTLLIYNIDPYLTLVFTIKLYTNDTNLIYGINDKSLYFGLDLMIENLDITTRNYRGDIVVCKINKFELDCRDYAYDYSRQIYVENANEKHLKSMF